MAHHKSAKKRIRTNEKRRLYNRSIKSRVKTYTRYAVEAIETAEKNSDGVNEMKEDAVKKLHKAFSEIQRAASKGVLHKNTAARKTGRLALRFNKVFISAQ
ncbi:MAG: 30S ribosomal protein S20 [bacterium]